MSDPNLIICGNCGEKYEDHWPVRVTDGSTEEVRWFCEDPPYGEFHTSSDFADWIDGTPTFTPETAADRQAAYAADRGI